VGSGRASRLLVARRGCHLDIHRHSRERAGMGDRGGSAVGARYIVREDDTTQTVLNIKRAQGCCPRSPSREVARDQSSFTSRGLPSKGEARALHHQPAPTPGLDHALPFAVSQLLSEAIHVLLHPCPPPARWAEFSEWRHEEIIAREGIFADEPAAATAFA